MDGVPGRSKLAALDRKVPSPKAMEIYVDPRCARVPVRCFA